MASKQSAVFHSLKAWFSNSVPQKKKLLWKKHGGTQIFSLKEANFIFTSDGSCPDTLSIFDSEEFLLGFWSVFHATYIDACVEKKTAHEVAAVGYIVLPPDMSDDVKNLAFVEGTTAVEGVTDTQQTNRVSRDAEHSCRSEGFVGGLEVKQSDVDFTTDDLNLESIPHVNSMARVLNEFCDFTPGANGFSVSLKT